MNRNRHGAGYCDCLAFHLLNLHFRAFRRRTFHRVIYRQLHSVESFTASSVTLHFSSRFSPVSLRQHQLSDMAALFKKLVCLGLLSVPAALSQLSGDYTPPPSYTPPASSPPPAPPVDCVSAYACCPAALSVVTRFFLLTVGATGPFAQSVAAAAFRRRH